MHFTTKSYDYFKYQGKIKTTFDTFSARKDAYLYQKLSRNQEAFELILSNIVENPKLSIYDLFEDSAKQVHTNWKKRIESITYQFQNNLNLLHENYADNFISINGNYPYVIDLYLQRKLPLEVLCILVRLSNSIPYWKQTVVDKVVFPDIINKIENYLPFLAFDELKLKKILKGHFSLNNSNK